MNYTGEQLSVTLTNKSESKAKVLASQLEKGHVRIIALHGPLTAPATNPVITTQ